jgi:hypothetical protein
MNGSFICNQDKVESKLKTLTKTGTSDDGWTQYYHDNNSNEDWLLTNYDSEYHGGGVPVLKRLPELSIEELIEIAMSSTDTNDIVGASLEFSEREKYNEEEFREKLISRLVQLAETPDLPDFELERLKIIIYESDLYDATNRRNIVGKHFTEIEKDAEYFKVISQKAKKILADIKEL